MDNVDTEDLILKEKLSRQIRTPLSSVIKKDGVFNLFEHFLVYGNSNIFDEGGNLQLIYKYPQEKEYVVDILPSCQSRLKCKIGWGFSLLRSFASHQASHSIKTIRRARRHASSM